MAVTERRKAMGYIVVIAVLILVVALCVRSIVRDHRHGSSCGGNSCSGDCGSCGGCGGQDIIITVKRKR